MSSTDIKEISDVNKGVVRTADHPVIVWNRRVSNTELEKFRKLIEDKYNQRFDSYFEFQKWSVKHYIDFWKEIWSYFNIISSKPYNDVLVRLGKGFMDCEWFRGAKLNLAENILRIRDDRVGLICEDELGNRETFTFAQMFEEVKMYAAAFRQQGLVVGDRVSYYISNRKEALFAMLATLSIGAIWGGPEPFYGPRTVSKIMELLDPKFIITVDRFQNDGEQFHLIDNLKSAIKNLPNLKKVIIVSTENDTSLHINDIPKSILLEDFLREGRLPDGSVPDIVFEQLPPHQPTNINFTSGTTGNPKGVVHSAVSFLAQMRDFSLHLNLKSGDVLYLHCPVGWAVWDYHIPILSLGSTLFLFDGSPDYAGQGLDIWETFARNKVSHAYLASAYIDYFNEHDIVPSSGTDLDCFKILCLGASPVKPSYYEFLHKRVKEDLVVCSWYGATEVFGAFSGLDLNSPIHMCEIQGPSLGLDLQCFDQEGCSVVGRKGDVVVRGVANPSFPHSLWGDEDDEKLKEEYLSKFPGVWTQNDECWVNPKTKGFVITGRSDDTLKQNGQRFGSSDVYFAIAPLIEIADSACVGQRRSDGESRAVLFVKLSAGYSLTDELREKIASAIEEELTEDCVPEVIVEVPDIPYNVNNKRMESTIRKIVETNIIPEMPDIKNPESLQSYCNIPEIINFNV